jgi:hypothetical protein
MVLHGSHKRKLTLDNEDPFTAGLRKLLAGYFLRKALCGLAEGAYKNSDNRLRRLCPSENAVSMVSIKEREVWIAAEILRQRGLSTRV